MEFGVVGFTNVQCQNYFVCVLAFGGSVHVCGVCLSSVFLVCGHGPVCVLLVPVLVDAHGFVCGVTTRPKQLTLFQVQRLKLTKVDRPSKRL